MNPEKVPQMSFPICEIKASAARRARSFSEGVVENRKLPPVPVHKTAGSQAPRREVGGGRLSNWCHISPQAGLPVLAFPALASSVAVQREPGFGPQGAWGTG